MLALAHIDWSCSRYDHAYPYLINNDPSLGNPASRDFQFLSCSGALADDVLQKQIPQLKQNQDVILLSIGTNSKYQANIIQWRWC